MEALNILLNSFQGGIIAFSIDQYHVTSSVIRNLDLLIDEIKETQKLNKYSVRLHYATNLYESNSFYRKCVDKVKDKTNCLLWDGSYYWSNIPSLQPSKEEFFYYVYNKEKRFKFHNLLFKIMLSIHAFLPKLMNAMVEKYAQKIFNI